MTDESTPGIEVRTRIVDLLAAIERYEAASARREHLGSYSSKIDDCQRLLVTAVLEEAGAVELPSSRELADRAAWLYRHALEAAKVEAFVEFTA